MELSESQKAITIMLVDDSVINHYLIKTLFRKQGFTNEVSCFESAEEALMQLRNTDEYSLPDVIILDINMPGMNGFDFLHEFDGLGDNIKQRCKIVMLSSSMDTADINRATSNPFVRLYLHKPINKESIGLILKAI